MFQVLPVGGARGGECFLVLFSRSALLFDSGFDFCAQQMADNVAAGLAGRSLELVLLSHSHYDHALGSTAIRRRFPGARVAASPLAARTFQKESARELMRSLDRTAAASLDRPHTGGDSIDRLAVDLTPADGETFRGGELLVQALDTPGHTRDSMSWWLAEHGLLIASESTGVVLEKTPDAMAVVPAFIVSYSGAMESLDRMERLRPRHLLLPHGGLLSGGEVAAYFREARSANRASMEFVLSLHRRGHTVEEIVDAYRDRFFTETAARYQPRRAWDLNTSVMVPRLLQEAGPAPLPGEHAG